MFPDRLYEELKKRGKTTIWLSEKTQISQQVISSWKKAGNPKIDKIIKIAECLNISIDYLLEIEPRQPDNINLTEDEKKLITYYRQIDDDVGKSIVKEIAKREASRYEVPKKSYNSKIG